MEYNGKKLNSTAGFFPNFGSASLARRPSNLVQSHYVVWTKCEQLISTLKPSQGIKNCFTSVLELDSENLGRSKDKKLPEKAIDN